VQDVLAGANDLAQEKLSNIRTIRAFGQEEKETAGYLKKAASILEMKYREAMASGTFFAINGFSGNAIILTVFYFGGSSIAHGVITIGDLTSFLMYSAWVGISMSGKLTYYKIAKVFILRILIHLKD
jgi:ATP-binding cassette subfamily B (MDR/TAP) protein 10